MWKLSPERYLWTAHPVQWEQGLGFVVISLGGVKVEHSFRLGFRASNKEAGYEALLAGLRTVLNLGVTNLEVYSNSRLVVS